VQVHVSQLKLAQGFKGTVISALPSDAVQYRVPVHVPGNRFVSKSCRHVEQALVKWPELSDELSTWGNLNGLKQFSPAAPAWGQPGFQGGENVISVGMPDAKQEVRHSDRVRRPNVRVTGPEWQAPRHS
jgi:hypothetical protein